MKKNLLTNEPSAGWCENLKGILVLGSLVGLGLYLLSRVLFNEFETTVAEEILLVGKIWLASQVLVLSSSVVLLLAGMLFRWFGRRRREKGVMETSAGPGETELAKNFA